MNLSDLSPAPGSTRKRKRVGRGPGSGLGKTSGRGEKGQRSRSGYKSKAGFEGGQMPLIRRVPKRGFTNIFKKEWTIVNLDRLNELDGDKFTPESLVASGAIRKLAPAGLRVLGSGELERSVEVHAHHFSKSAAEKIEKAGGKAVVIETPERADRNPKTNKLLPRAKRPQAAK